MSRHLIISAALNYREVDTRVFLRSAARHVPEADVLLFTEKEDADYRRALEADHPGVRLIRPPGIERRQRMWRSRRRRRKLTRLPPRKAMLNARLLQTPFWPYASAPLHIVMARHFWAAWALHQPDYRHAEKVLLCDSRDICFQADPFSYAGDGITVGANWRPQKERPRGLGWIKRRYPEAISRVVAERPVTSAGATLGGRWAMQAYLEGMKREIARLAPTLFGTNGDQRIHNVLLHTLIDIPVTILPDDNPAMAHLHSARWENFIFDEEGLKNSRGEPIALLHLYEAFPELEGQIEARYGAKSGSKADLRTGHRPGKSLRRALNP